jgi:hypothetical protein
MSRGNIGANALPESRKRDRICSDVFGIDFCVVAVRQKFLTFSSLRPLRGFGIGIIV